MLTLLRLWAGKALNAIGVPGVVRPGTYEAAIAQASVRITVGPLFTVVTVNGIDVYLHRVTGAIDGVGFGTPTGRATVDGVGFGAATGCRTADTRGPARGVAR